LFNLKQISSLRHNEQAGMKRAAEITEAAPSTSKKSR